jgi:PAS domain S-box-containing protein
MSGKKTDKIVIQQMEKMDQSEARFRIIFDTAAVGIGLMSLDRRLLDANPALCRMFGLSREELIGQTPVIVTYPEDYPVSTQQFEDLLSGKENYYWGERRYLRKNGEVFWAYITMSVVRHPNGKPLYIVGILEDINRQKKALTELQKSEARFRTIFENAPIGIALVGLDTHPMSVNPAIVRMTGYSEQELLSMSGLELSHPDDRAIAMELMNDLLDGKRKMFQVDSCFIRKDGHSFWVKQNISTLSGPDGKPANIVVMVEDIDEQKRIQAELSLSEQHFRSVFENSAIGISLIGLDRKPFAINKALLDMTGYDLDELKKKTGREVSFPEDIDIGTKEFWDVVNGTRVSYQLEKRYLRKDGSVYWARLTVSGVHDTDGKLQYLVAMTEDITNQKLALEHLHESDARFRAIFDNVSVGMAMLNLDRQVLAVNQALVRITGYSADELAQVDISTITHPDDLGIGREHFLDMIAGKRDNTQMERRYVHKDGNIFWARITYSLVRDTNGTPQYLVGSLEDITEQKLAGEKMAAQEAEYLRILEQRVEERTRELSEANLRLVDEIEQRQKAEEALAAKAAEEAILVERTRLARELHDAVTQTLFSASLIAEVLPELWEINPDEARKSNEELRQLTRGALAEMRTLLLELRPAALTQARFADLVRQLSEAVIGRTRTSVNLEVNGDYDLPPDIKVAFYRIAQESLNNIVKYSRATRVDINIRLECCNVSMVIKDNGVGFSQAKVKPTSLGMRIMYERADAIHAHLNISSTPGQGTSVCVDWNEDDPIQVSKISAVR